MPDTILIKNFPNRLFADQAKEILNRNGIPCILNSTDAGILGTQSSGSVQGVDLYVQKKNKKKAFELLNALFDGI